MADMEPTKRIDSLFERISALIEQARGYVVNSVKIAEVKTRYEVGRYIYEDEQQGERAAYGELIDNQVPYGYDERYKFTGKERDWETGLLRANELITYSPIVLNYHKINLLKNIHELLLLSHN
ncbi:MAG: hypothetical protein ACI4AI_06055 [Paludibacteraceae bacterium]